MPKNNRLMRFEQTPAPLLPVAQAVIVGIILARVGFMGPLGWAIILGICIIISGILIFSGKISHQFQRLHRICWILLCVGFAGVGALRYYLIYHYYPKNHIVHYCTDQQSLATLRGAIVTRPYLVKSSGSMAAFDFMHEPSTIFTLRCTEVLGPQSWIETSGLVYIVVNQPGPLLQIGQEVQIDGWIALRRGPNNPGQADRRDYHRAARNLVVCYVNYVEAVSILDKAEKKVSLIYRIRQKMQDIAYAAVIDDAYFAAADKAASEDSQAFLAALLLGQRYNIRGRLNEIFARTGTLHYLSLSGFHVGLLAGFVWWLSWLFKLPRWLRGLTSLAAIGMFVLMAPPRAPIIRAGLICGVFCVAYMTRRTTNGINLVSFAALVLLLWRPLDLFAPGFQLSFGVVLAILVFARAVFHRQIIGETSDMHRIHTQIRWRKSLDESLSWRQYLLQNVGRWLVGLFVVALVAWLTGMPLIAYHFHRITPWAILGSVVLFPLVSLTMLFGFAKLLLVGVFPVIGWLLSWPLRTFSDITITTAQYLAKLPYSNINTAPPPLWFIAIFYLLLVWAGLSVRRGKQVARMMLVGLLIWMIAFVWWTPFQQKSQPSEGTRLDVLAVGHGCAAVVELPDGKVICYDAGSMSNFSMGDNIIVPFLRSRGIQSLEALFISHDNIDHFSGVLEVCRDFNVKAVYVSEHLYRNRGAAGEFLLKALADSDIPLRLVNRQSCPFNSDAPEHEAYKIDVLWPPESQINNDLDSNDSSLVLRVSDDQGAILLCGDIGPRPQQQLMQLESTVQLQADVLLLPHHGSTTTILPAFVEAVDPEICLSSDGQLQQRSFGKLQLMLPGRKIIHTFELGAVRVGLTKDGIKIDSFHKDYHVENDK